MTDFSDKIVYQVYPKSFQDSNSDGIGDLRGLIQRLDYLEDLGVDYLWVTPVFQSPQNDNGYDVSDYCKIEPKFGSMQDMDELIAECDKRGIGVMLDMVFNHTSTEHIWFQKALAGDTEYQDYYIFKEGGKDKPPTNWESKFGGPAWEYVQPLGKWYLHLFDVTQADLNWDNPKVRDELKKVICFWKGKGVKGFRFDVVNLISKPEIFEDDLEGDGRRFYTDGPHVHEYLKELVHDTGIGQMVTVGEMSSTSIANCIRYSNPDEKELSMCFNFHHLKTDYKDGNKWKLMEPDRMALKKLFEEWQVKMQDEGGWNALFWCNHDQPHIVSRMGDEGRYWKQSAKMLAACIHLMRGTPYIYQGEELGMTNPHFREISQYRDVESKNYYQILLKQGNSQKEALEVLAARSRDNGRTLMQWSNRANAGFTDGKPWIEAADNYCSINAESQMEDQDSIRTFYKRLIVFRKTRDTVSKGIIEFFEKENPDVLAYRRVYGKNELIVFNNLTAAETVVALQPGWMGYQKALGNYDACCKADSGVVLRPFETLVLEGSDCNER